MRRTGIVAAVAVLLGAAPGWAQSVAAGQQAQKSQADTAASTAGGVGTHSTPGTLSDKDQAFLREEAQGASYELALAQLAQRKAAKPSVKSYASTVIRDHEQINTGLQHLAQVKGVTLPTGLKPEDQARLDRFKGLSGSAFDHQFTTEEARINSQDKLQAEAEAGATQDTDMKAFVQQMQVADANHQKLSQRL